MSDARAQRVALVAGDLAASGAQSITTSLARRLKVKGRDVMVLCSGGPGLEHLQAQGIPSVLYSGAASPWLFWKRKSVEAELTEFKPDILHAQSHSLARYTKHLASLLDCPYLITVTERVAKPGKLPYDRKLLRGIIATDDPLREELVNVAKVPRELVSLIPNGVSLGSFRQFQPRPSQEGNGPDGAADGGNGKGKGGNGNGKTPVVGMISPTEKDRGLEVFLQAAQKVLEEKPEVHFLVSGKSSQTRKLRELVSKLGVRPSLTFVDHAESHGQLFSAMDVFVLPSTGDTHGVTLLEAMACGKPVVASGVGGVYSIVRDRETGLIVPRQDAQAMAQAVLDILDSPDFAQELSDQALETIESEFDQDALFEKLFRAYDGALAVLPNGKAGHA